MGTLAQSQHSELFSTARLGFTWSDWSTASIATGLQKFHGQSLSLRFVDVNNRFMLIDQPDLQLNATVGLALPTTALSDQVAFTPMTTGSQDPLASAHLAVGGTWVTSLSAAARVPVVAGSDDVRQGVYTRADVRLARRLGETIPWLGGSGVMRTEDDGGGGDFQELGAIAGVVRALSTNWSIQGQARLPVWSSPDMPYDVAVGIGLNWVMAPKAKDEAEDDHHQNDGHHH